MSMRRERLIRPTYQGGMIAMNISIERIKQASYLPIVRLTLKKDFVENVNV